MTDKSAGLKCDQVIRLTGFKTSTLNPQKLRSIKYKDPDTYLLLAQNMFF